MMLRQFMSAGAQFIGEKLLTGDGAPAALSAIEVERVGILCAILTPFEVATKALEGNGMNCVV